MYGNAWNRAIQCPGDLAAAAAAASDILLLLLFVCQLEPKRNEKKRETVSPICTPGICTLNIYFVKIHLYRLRRHGVLKGL